MSPIVGTLKNPQQARKWLLWAMDQIAPLVTAGEWINVEFWSAKSRAQERMYHNIFRDVAAQAEAPLVGKTDAETWKRLLVDAFYRATKEDSDLAAEWVGRAPRIVPNLDGTGFVTVEVQTRRFTKRLASNFVSYLHAWGDEHGIRWSASSLGRDGAAAAGTVARVEGVSA